MNLRHADTALAELLDTRIALDIAGIALDIRGPRRLVEAVRTIFWRHALADVPPNAIAVALRASDSDNSRAAAIRGVSEAVVTAFSAVSPLLVLDGAVVAYGERAVCLVGDRPHAATALAAHLLSRGWKLVSAQHALIRLESCTFERLHRTMEISSRWVASLPAAIRAACETSPWFVAEDDDLVFYGVDPASHLTRPWSDSAKLTHVLFAEDSRAIVPLIHEQHAWDVIAPAVPRSMRQGYNFSDINALTLALRHVAGGRLRVGNLPDSAEAVESWVVRG